METFKVSHYLKGKEEEIGRAERESLLGDTQGEMKSTRHKKRSTLSCAEEASSH